VKLLILSNYFTPDLGAGSFRIQGLIEALEPYRKEDLSVDLITTMPNRYADTKVKALSYEDRGWLRIHRINLPGHQNGMVDQAISYLTYAQAVRKLTRYQQWDLVFATSSRLMTAALGAYVAKRINAPLYLDIRDLFTLNMRELLGQSPMQLFLPLFRLIERRAFRSAACLNVVSEGFVAHILSLVPDAEVRCFTNGIDEIFLSEGFLCDRQRQTLPLILYAGNIGDGQGLHHIVPDVAKRLEGKARLRIIGDGSKRKALEDAVTLAGVNNVELLMPVKRAVLLEHYHDASILFLHLNELEAFQKVLPSKIFEYAATRRPILAGVDGYAAEFLGRHLPDVEVFKPLDVNAMVAAVDRLLVIERNIDRYTFFERFSRRNIMDRMAIDILTTGLRSDFKRNRYDKKQKKNL